MDTSPHLGSQKFKLVTRKRNILIEKNILRKVFNCFETFCPIKARKLQNRIEKFANKSSVHIKTISLLKEEYIVCLFNFKVMNLNVFKSPYVSSGSNK